MERTIKATANHGKRTFTLRIYDNGHLYAKYRTIPQDRENFNYYANFATQNDWRQFLKTDEYYVVKYY